MQTQVSPGLKWISKTSGPPSTLGTRARSLRNGLGKKAPDLTGCAHHAIAEALHVELAHVAFPVRAFGLFLADQGATVFLQ